MTEDQKTSLIIDIAGSLLVTHVDKNGISDDVAVANRALAQAEAIVNGAATQAESNAGYATGGSGQSNQLTYNLSIADIADYAKHCIKQKNQLDPLTAAGYNAAMSDIIQACENGLDKIERQRFGEKPKIHYQLR